MKFKTLILLLLVVVLPTALLSWGGFQLARQQSFQLENRLKSLMRDQLAELDSRIKKYFARGEAALQRITSRSYATIDSIRETVDEQGLVDNLFIIAANDVLIYPNPVSPLNQREKEFYTKIKTIVDDNEIQNQILKIPSRSNQKITPSSEPQKDEQTGAQESVNLLARPDANRSPSQQSQLQQSTSPTELTSNSPLQSAQQASNEMPSPSYEVCEGWFVWYWGRGVNLIFWQRLVNGNIVCVALERSRWMADLIAELPDTISSIDKPNDQPVRSTRIINSGGETVYQWGDEVDEQMVLAAEMPVSNPLNSWKLQMWVARSELQSQTLVGLNIAVGIVAFVIALVAVTWNFFREYTKDLQEASKRVSFVNQVSHELRTPLTNIRMYAELLQQEIGDIDGLDAETARKRIEVVESESHRLSRLIANVLSFAGSQKKKLELRASTGVVDDCIRNVISSFTPQLERLGIEIQTDLQATEPVRFDADALGQMVGNLISNVEKYAADGEFVTIKTRQEKDQVVVIIEDDGRGIDPKHAEKIFEPFWRLSHELQHASGTGIGLSISRELARIHGGDLTLEDSSCGARFVIRINTESGD